MTPRLAFSVIAAAVVLVVIAMACSSNPVPVATFECVASDTGDSGLSPSVIQAHTCPAGQYCERPSSSCDSPTGTCVSIDAGDTADSGFECGCDGITYYNRSLRRAAQISLQATNFCQWGSPQTKSCNGGMECAPGQSCAVIGPSLEALINSLNQLLPPGQSVDAGMFLAQCQRDDPNRPRPSFPAGVCWALPATEPSVTHLLADVCGHCANDWKLIKGQGFISSCPADASAAD